MAKSVAGVMIEMSANVAKLQTDMTKATNVVSGFTRKAESAFKGMAVTLAAAFSAQAIISGMKQTLETLDKLDESAQKFGMTVEGLQVWAQAAKQAGVDTEKFEKGLGKLAQSAYNGSEAFDALGMTTKNTDGTLKNTDVLLAELADKFKDMADGTQKAALAKELLGRSGIDLIPILNQGSAAVEELRTQMGYLASADDAARAGQFNDTLDMMGRQFEGVKMAILSGALPAFQKLAEGLLETSKDAELFRSIGEAIGNMANWMAKGVLGVAAAFDIVGKAIGGATAKLAIYGEAYTKGGLIGMIQQGIKGTPSVTAGLSDTAAEWGKKIAAIGASGGATSSFKSRAISGGFGKSEMEKAGKAAKQFKEEIEQLDYATQNLSDRTIEWYTELEHIAGLFDPLTTRINKLTEQAELLVLAGADATTTYEELYEAIDQLQATRDTFDKVNDKAKEMSSIFEGVTNSMDDALAEFCKNGEINFSNLINSMLADLSKIAMAQIANKISGGTSNNLMESVIKGIGGLFGSVGGSSGSSADYLMFADGGVVTQPTRIGGSGIMGEAGPEAIVPLESYDVIRKSNNSSGGNNTTFFIQAVDSKSFEDTLKRNPGAVIKVMDQALRDNEGIRQTIRRTK